MRGEQYRLGSAVLFFALRSVFCFATEAVPDSVKDFIGHIEKQVSQVQEINSNTTLTVQQRTEALTQVRQETETVIARVKPEDPGYPAVMTSAARVALEAGEYPLAVQRANEAVAKAPGDPHALVTRALAHYGACDFPKANEDAAAAFAASSGDHVARAVYKLSRRPAGCGGMEGEAVELEHRRIENLAKLTARTGPGAPAAGSYTRESFLKFEATLDRADKALFAKDFPAAYRDATWALVLYPDNPRALLQRAEASMGLNNYAEAAADATNGLKLRPDSWQFLGVRAMALNEAGKPARALADAVKAIQLKPNHAEAWLVKALAREKLGESPAEFLEDFKRASELNPRYEPLYEAALARASGRPEGREITAASSVAAAEGSSRDVLNAIPLSGSLGAAALLALLLTAYVFGRSGASQRQTFVFPGAAPGGAALPVSADSYEIGPEIGRGGMGAVYEGLDKNLDRKVAIKELRPELREDPKERDRFLQEARLVATLSHPNVVSIFAVIREAQRILLVFEYVEGQTLHQAIQGSPGRRLSLEEAAPIVRQVCAALGYAHAKRIIHRDLKPSNIMRTLGGVVKVMDFGIARIAKDSVHSQTGSWVGTPLYMAPEMDEGKVSPESDLYSLGVTVYEMLTGAVPFDGATLRNQKLQAKFDPASTRVPGLPKKLDEFFLQALQPDPSKRFKTAPQFEGAFLAAITAA